MNEKEMIRESMSREQSKSAELIRRLESDVKALTEARSEDKKYIEMLEKELRNCSQEIGYLQDELNLRNVEANCVGEHVHSLELKLSEVGRLHEKVTELMEELDKSGSQCLFLKRALEHKETELQNSASHIEKLENAISSIALESQCEIEGVKLDFMDLEQRYLEAKKLDEQAIQEKANMESLIEDLEVRLEETEQMVSNLENDNRELHEKLRKSEENVKMFYETVEEHLDKWFINNNNSVFCTPGVSNQPFHTKLENRLPTLEQLCSREVLEPFLSKLAAAKTCDLKEEMEKMSNHICESELVVKQLKEELREEKAKAKEEAEDLTQEMAELRYQITDMLEQECKRRSCIEQASLQRIAELEAQVREEQRKYFIAIRRYHEAQKLAESRSAEVHHLKNTLAVVFVPDYNVSVAEQLIPASELSQHISTAGMEASGTSNMKFAMNGCVLIGTLDGANVEIREEVGEENFFLFGARAHEIAGLRKERAEGKFVPDPRFEEVKKFVRSGAFGSCNYDELMGSLEGNEGYGRGDYFLVGKDFPSYIECQEKVDEAYQDQKRWTRMSILNTAGSYKFSSDRTIHEYAKDIWDIKPAQLP